MAAAEGCNDSEDSAKENKANHNRMPDTDDTKDSHVSDDDDIDMNQEVADLLVKMKNPRPKPTPTRGKGRGLTVSTMASVQGQEEDNLLKVMETLHTMQRTMQQHGAQMKGLMKNNPEQPLSPLSVAAPPRPQTLAERQSTRKAQDDFKIGFQSDIYDAVMTDDLFTAQQCALEGMKRAVNFGPECYKEIKQIIHMVGKAKEDYKVFNSQLNQSKFPRPKKPKLPKPTQPKPQSAQSSTTSFEESKPNDPQQGMDMATDLAAFYDTADEGSDCDGDDQFLEVLNKIPKKKGAVQYKSTEPPSKRIKLEAQNCDIEVGDAPWNSTPIAVSATKTMLYFTSRRTVTETMDVNVTRRVSDRSRYFATGAEDAVIGHMVSEKRLKAALSVKYSTKHLAPNQHQMHDWLTT